MNANESTRIRVGIVDDSDDVRYLLATMLEVDGRFQIVGEAQSAVRGLAMVTETEPNLVLVDLHLNDHDGTWLVREIRRRCGDIAVAVVTASARPEEHHAAMSAGADVVHNKVSMTSTMMDELADLFGERVAVA